MDGLAEGGVLAERYRLGSVAGHGAMGEVHLAEDLRLARPVAIKSLRSELARYAEVRERFNHEAKAAARISHPNVVRVYDSGEHEGIPYLVMECLPGTSLVDELAWGVLDPRRARRVGLDVLGALDAAHRLGVVHRDVKPGNILLTAVLDGPVKVSDFGIAKSADDGSLTDSGGLVGTAAYLAPERVAGGPAGPASDLYSLGVVLFESLAGRKPHEGDTALALALATHMGEAPSLGELRPDLDPALVAVVDKALAHDPAARWTTAAEMAEALRAWRPKASRSDPPTGTAPAVGAPAATVALPTEALAPAGSRSAAAASGGRPSGPDGRARFPRRVRLPVLGGVVLLLVVVVAVAGLVRRGSDGDAADPPVTVEGGPGPAPTTTLAVTAAPTSAPPTTRAVRRPAVPVTTAAPTTTRPTATTRRTTTTRLAATTTTPTTPPPPPTTPPTTAAPAVVAA